MKIRLIILVGLFLALVLNPVLAEENTVNNTCSNAPALRQSITIIKNGSNVQDSRYKILPGDTISFSVYDDQTFLQPEIIIRPDGFATIEPLGEIYVAGYDVSSLSKILEEKLSYYIKNPRISINIKDFHPATIYIYGAVQKPGMYQLVIQSNKGSTDTKNPTVKTDMSISNVISNAGGVTYDADLNHVKITSSDGSQKEINLRKLIAEGDTTQNIILSSGDKIDIPEITTVPPNDEDFKLLANSSLFPEAFPVIVLGEVNKPGIYELPTTTPYLNSAVALASGYTINSNKNFVKIYRKTLNDSKISQINVNLNKVDLVLRPNDIVFVNDRKFIKAVRLADYLSRLMNPAVVPANTYNTWAEVFDPGRQYKFYRKYMLLN